MEEVLQVNPLCQENEEESTFSNEQVVAKIMKFAKLDLTQVDTNVEQLYFSPNLSSDSIKLLELNDQTLACLESGESLYIKGEGAENAVICTDSQTFELKDTEISNSLLVVPELQFNERKSKNCHSVSDCVSEKGLGDAVNRLHLHEVHIEAVSHSYLEMKAVRPKLNKIIELLQPTSYKGPECEDLVTAAKVTRDQLESRVLASTGEIDSALLQLNVVEMDGFVRLLDFDYLSRVVASITALLEENSWHFDDFCASEIISGLKDLYPELIIKSMLKCYGRPKTEDSRSQWLLDEDKICRFFAELLLRPTRVFNLTEFMEAWKQSVPEGMITSQEQLKGLAFTDCSGNPAVIRYFPESHLSEDVKVRFEQLFKVKDVWSMPELTPYLESLCIGKMTVGVLVTKYARACKKNGIKCYTSKYLK